jgi:hypothetical protein
MPVCARKPEPGERVDIPCPDCGHYYALHVGTRLCPVCRLEAIAAATGPGPNPALEAFDRIGMGWLKRFAVEQGFEDAAAVARPAQKEEPRPVKTCLRAVLDENGQPGRLLDLSMVGDDHEFGPSPDGSEIHIQGRGGFTVSRGTPCEGTPPQPPAVNGIPFSQAVVSEDGYISRKG